MSALAKKITIPVQLMWLCKVPVNLHYSNGQAYVDGYYLQGIEKTQNFNIADTGNAYKNTCNAIELARQFINTGNPGIVFPQYAQLDRGRSGIKSFETAETTNTGQGKRVFIKVAISWVTQSVVNGGAFTEGASVAPQDILAIYRTVNHTFSVSGTANRYENIVKALQQAKQLIATGNSGYNDGGTINRELSVIKSYAE